MSEVIKDIIDTMDKNIGILKGVKELNNEDVVMLFVELFSSLKDMWSNFQDVFARIQEITEMENMEDEKNKKCKPMDKDFDMLYQ